MQITMKSARVLLEDAFTLPFKVRVSLCFWDPDEQGLSSVNKKRTLAIIKINNTLDPKHQVDELVHEWAHLVAWDYYGSNSSAVWAVAYDECYNAVYGGH